MRKCSIIFSLVFAFVIGSFISANAAEASGSNESLQKQIASLKSTVEKQKKQLKEKDKQITDLKKQISYSVRPLSTKVAYEGNVVSGNYQIGNSSVPALLDYKGIKYVPTDLIGNLLNYKAIFNKSTNTIFFGTEPSGTYMSDILKPYYSSKTIYTNKTMKMGGQLYNKGYSMEFYWSDNDKYSMNLGGKYSHITGVLGIDDDSSHFDNTTFSIYGDGKLLGTYNIEEGGLPVNIDLDVTNVKKLEISAKVRNYSDVDFANVIIN